MQYVHSLQLITSKCAGAGTGQVLMAINTMT